MPSYQYRDSNYEYKTVSRRSHLCNGIPIPGKTVFILRQGPGGWWATGNLCRLFINYGCKDMEPALQRRNVMTIQYVISWAHCVITMMYIISGWFVVQLFFTWISNSKPKSNHECFDRMVTKFCSSQQWVAALTLQWRHNGHDGVSKTSLAIVYSSVYSGADQRKHQSFASLTFMREIHRWPVSIWWRHHDESEIKFPFDLNYGDKTTSHWLYETT